MGSAEDLSLQCHFWTLYVRLVGALSLQYPFILSSLKDFVLVPTRVFWNHKIQICIVFSFLIILMIDGRFWRFNCLDSLYMVDILVILLMWFVCYNGVRNASEFCKRYLVSFLLDGNKIVLIIASVVNFLLRVPTILIFS